MSSGTKGRFTFRSAGVIFLLSAIAEIFSLTSEVLLFGAVRGGIAAAVYHLAYVSLFFFMGIGLWQGKPWGYKLVFIGTIFYTLDRAQYLLDRKSIEVSLAHQLGSYKEIWEQTDKGLVIQAVTLMILIGMVSWWGFALYTYIRRDYFLPIEERSAAETAIDDEPNPSAE
ncbi:MAG: hypothetical protein H8E17_18835 [Deltaproteobacteria bacterium]|nr:hypothetical protein [Deltaproteobacteria bacterium]